MKGREGKGIERETLTRCVTYEEDTDELIVRRCDDRHCFDDDTHPSKRNERRLKRMWTRKVTGAAFTRLAMGKKKSLFSLYIHIHSRSPSLSTGQTGVKIQKKKRESNLVVVNDEAD